MQRCMMRINSVETPFSQTLITVQYICPGPAWPQMNPGRATFWICRKRPMVSMTALLPDESVLYEPGLDEIGVQLPNTEQVIPDSKISKSAQSNGSPGLLANASGANPGTTRRNPRAIAILIGTSPSGSCLSRERVLEGNEAPIGGSACGQALIEAPTVS